jgi:hypothetical protein
MSAATHATTRRTHAASKSRVRRRAGLLCTAFNR